MTDSKHGLNFGSDALQQQHDIVNKCIKIIVLPDNNVPNASRIYKYILT